MAYQEPTFDYNSFAHLLFDPRLRSISLAADQIEGQDLSQLEESLEKINEAIANADSFGKFRVNFAIKAGKLTPIVAAAGEDYQLELGILPLLLERKGQILDRIRTLRPEQEENELREDIAANVGDPEERDRLFEAIDRRFEEQRRDRDDLSREQEEVETARAEIREREQRLQIEIRERRSAIYRSFLEREPVASIVGALLLIALTAALIVGMFTHVTAPEVLANAFLLILGYFFGQATSRDRSKSSSNERSSEESPLV